MLALTERGMVPENTNESESERRRASRRAGCPRGRKKLMSDPPTLSLGALGIGTRFDRQSAVEARQAAREIEALGFGALWLPEALGREALSQAALLLGATERMIVAAGIANIYARDAFAAAAGQKTLAEAYPGRFLLGLGVSHAPLVEQLRGHRYEKPLAAMRAYLDAMDRAPYNAVAPAVKPARLLAALGPKMLELAGERSSGALTYFATPEHTARARKILGADRLLAVEQDVVLERDPRKAREIARAHMAFYLQLPSYLNNLRALGFGDGDFAGGGVDAAAARVHEHRAAGADHVCLQVLTAEPELAPRREWRALAAALLGRN